MQVSDNLHKNNMELNKRSFGAEGEAAAVEFLEENGFSILEKNFRFSRMGEIDIIAKENEYICIVEVKMRSNSYYGAPSEAVDARKQQRIKRLAMVFLKQHNLIESFIRFDVVEVECTKTANGHDIRRINLIRNAF